MAEKANRKGKPTKTAALCKHADLPLNEVIKHVLTATNSTIG